MTRRPSARSTSRVFLRGLVARKARDDCAHERDDGSCAPKTTGSLRRRCAGVPSPFLDLIRAKQVDEHGGEHGRHKSRRIRRRERVRRHDLLRIDFVDFLSAAWRWSERSLPTAIPIVGFSFPARRQEDGGRTPAKSITRPARRRPGCHTRISKMSTVGSRIVSASQRHPGAARERRWRHTRQYC